MKLTDSNIFDDIYLPLQIAISMFHQSQHIKPFLHRSYVRQAVESGFFHFHPIELVEKFQHWEGFQLELTKQVRVNISIIHGFFGK